MPLRRRLRSTPSWGKIDRFAAIPHRPGAMSTALRQRLFDELDSITLVDPHTHINAHAPASTTLADILGYHYYTELAHSAGMPQARIEEPDLDPKEKVGRLVEYLGDNRKHDPVELALGDVPGILRLRRRGDHAGQLGAAVRSRGGRDESPRLDRGRCCEQSKLKAVFLTNDFDDPLSGFDTATLCSLPAHRRSGVSPGTGHRCASAWKRQPARASATRRRCARRSASCSSTLPLASARPAPFRCRRTSRRSRSKRPAPRKPSTTFARNGPAADTASQRELGHFVFWTLAEFCAEHHAAVRPDDRRQSRRLRRRRLSGPGPVRQPRVADSVPRTVQRVSPGDVSRFRCWPASRIRSWSATLGSFPTCVTNGHWWYSNTPTYIEHDAAAGWRPCRAPSRSATTATCTSWSSPCRSSPCTSGSWPKILAERFVVDRGWIGDACRRAGPPGAARQRGRRVRAVCQGLAAASIAVAFSRHFP